MIFLPEADLERLTHLMEGAAAGKSEAAARRVLEVFPGYAPAWMLVGSIAEDPAERMDALWKGVRLAPCSALAYLMLADHLTTLDEADPVAKHLRVLALWKIAFADEVPEMVVEHFEKDLGEAAKEPETYQMLAEAAEADFAKSPEPEKVSEVLRPFRLLNDLQREAPDVLAPATLDGIRQYAVECEPLLRSALREWGHIDDAVDDRSACLMLAILGEISGPDAVDELLELCATEDENLFLHTHWALHRLALRHGDAVLERFRAVLPGAKLLLRCAIADQIQILPPDARHVPLLTALVEDLRAPTSDHDAGYVLACVIQCLTERGEKERAAELARLKKNVPKDSQAEIRDAVRGDFVSRLAEEDITELTIEDVCLERLLMEDELDDEFDEDAEFDEDEFDDEDVEDIFEPERPPRPGRNDPCWCGSGKKYKKCHLAADEQADRQARDREDAEEREEDTAPLSAHARMMHRVMEGAQETISRRDMERAKKMYFDRKGNLELDEDQINGFFEWLLHDFRDSSSGRTPMENYLEARGAEFTAGERALLESLRDARFGLYEVERVEPGSGVHLHDIFAGDRMFVHDVNSSNSMSRWDCLLSRAQFHEGRWIFAGNGVLVPRTLLEQFRVAVERESRAAGQAPADFVRANSHRLHRDVKEMYDREFDNLSIVNREGEEVSFGKAEYEILDEPVLLANLRSVEDLEEGLPKPGENLWFTWLPTLGGEKRPMGSLEIEGGTLRLEAMSRTRLETLRGLVESHAGNLVKHQRDQYTSIEEIKERFRRGENGPKARPEASPEARAAVGRALTEHYSHWADDRLPALGGKTPRQSVRTKAGRQAVVDLLRLMENGEDRKKKAGEPAFDFNILRRELGLPEE